MVKFLDLYGQYQTIQEEMDAAIRGIISEGAFIGGVAVTDFESAFAGYQGAQHCVGVGNGTDALEIALEALSLPPGSAVIVPANSFIASSEAVTRAGLRVLFADVDSDTYTLDPEDVMQRLSDGVSAIMAVHLYGHPCDMDRIMELAGSYGLKVIEDCAQAHGAAFNGRRVGAIGDVGAFSFYPGKNLGAYGDAGAILTNDADLATRCRMIANHGRVDKYDHQFEGRNSRLDGLQAAVLGVKLRHLDGWLQRRIEVAALYRELLLNLEELQLPVVESNVRHAFHLFVIRTERRDELAAHLRGLGIATGVHYPVALPKLQAYRYLGTVDTSMRANQQDSQLLSLPMGEHLSDDDVRCVAHAVREFFA